MKWSKIRARLHELSDDNLQTRLDYHMTTYKNSTGYIGRAWITLDGKELVNFSNQDTYLEFGSSSNALVGTVYDTHDPVNEISRTPGKIMERGEFSKHDFGQSAWEFINLDIESALNSENPILRFLAMADRRVGLRRLNNLKSNEDHPLVKRIIEIRKEK